jgi:hypothetical protein
MLREKAKIFLYFFFLLICTSVIEITHAADDPTVLQQNAIKRIENFLDHFRRTGVQWLENHADETLELC